MKFDPKRSPPRVVPTPATIAVSMAAIDGALAELVSRVEREVAIEGIIASESASELRSLRIDAERLLAAQSEMALVC